MMLCFINTNKKLLCGFFSRECMAQLQHNKEMMIHACRALETSISPQLLSLPWMAFSLWIGVCYIVCVWLNHLLWCGQHEPLNVLPLFSFIGLPLAHNCTSQRQINMNGGSNNFGLIPSCERGIETGTFIHQEKVQITLAG